MKRAAKPRTAQTRTGKTVVLDRIEECIENGKVVGWFSYAYLSSTQYVDRCFIPAGDSQ
jgi:hypothetical protein